MSDNDRKNPHEIKQDHEHHDPLERLTRIFNPKKQSNNQNDQSPTQADQVTSHPSKASSPKLSSYDDFDLSFLEAQLENDLTNNLPLDDKILDTIPTSSFNNLERKRSLPEGENSSPMTHDEEKILDALSPLPIPKNQSQQNSTTSHYTDPFFENSDFSIQQENFFFDEADKNAKKTVSTEPTEQANHFSPTISQQENTAHIQQNYDDHQSSYDTYVNHPYQVSVDQENQVNEYHTDSSLASTERFFSSSEFISEKEDTGRNKITKDFPSALDSTQRGKQSDLKGFPQERHRSNYPQFYEEESLQQETYDEKNQRYYDIQDPYINSAENISERSNKKEVPYNQNNLNDMDASPETLNTKQTDSFFAYNYTHQSTPPPNVDTYKFAEEIVEKTGPIMVPEVPYGAPEYDVPTDGLKEEFADILNVGHIPEERFSQQQRENEIFNEIFHQTTHNPRNDVYTNSQTQNANYFPTDNMDYNSSSLTENPSHRSIDEIPTHASTTSHSKNFMIGKTLTRSAVILILIAVGFVGYSYFFTPSQKNEAVPIIHADNTPFKFKQETTETKNDVAHNLDIYKQETGQNEKQDNTQQFLIDNSEQPEKLSEVNQQESISSSSHSLDESEVEDAVTGAINHTIPTREVQTVIVNQDGTILLEPKHQTERKNADEAKEASDQTAVEQFENSSPVTSHESDNTETENDLTNDIDKIIAENASNSHMEEKVIPIPSHTERNSEQQIHATSRPTLPNQIVASNSEAYYVQLASQPTHALARDSLKKMQLRFAALIGARPLNIQSALIPGKGTYYRVRIQTQNRNDAINLCESIKNSGGSCFITR
ncbi:SPOR domain-containing protein [Bartonella florencae]|uniref:SPOR domain-containing protein n=1 Tax=Bartonella florencae TaxID=928210 RepID=UPI00030E6AD6|nr:SPOR domain-containing protein [Bartonella florencae]